ncbi:FeS assembly SUF system protein [Sphingomonas vulcanisoli]|uniref:FeS assembly SUF system protein n=1 Tax=Sphingomonas vulcanisoli TaxID=1658060 RepID=A0ABX0TUP3_9SPHN|nr:SUF system Fe-S cluster assembly protein [Sphingomonas vulcanisoli]NIJ09171.1 FeS assembly SUF system protein [Sphingomonas vulcanisoli]
MSDEDNRWVKIEDLAQVVQPPRARVSDVEEAPAARPRDYLEGFLAEKPQPLSGNEPGGALYEAVIDALKEIYDPEIPVNIYELGLVYGVDIDAGGHTVVSMTLTTPNCPVAETMPAEVEMRVGAVPGVGSSEVNLVWDPPWDPAKMSDEAKLELGML